jgi:SdiA-regulated
MKLLTLLFILSLLKITPGCKQSHSPVKDSTAEYDLTKPVIYKMLPVLDEISGISFLNGNSDTLYAEQDEEGKLFYFHLGDKEVRHTKFSKRGDYEDVAICNGAVIMLRSDGTLFTFPLSEIENKEIENVDEQNGILPEGEYESLFADESENNLYVLCKNCIDDKTDENITGHILKVSVNGKLIPERNFSIDIKSIADKLQRKNFRFKPSGMAQNKKTKEWYIISSVNKMLLITDDKWKPVHEYSLSPVLFTQPEGISFDKENNLYISNEIGNGQNGIILKFMFNKN